MWSSRSAGFGLAVLAIALVVTPSAAGAARELEMYTLEGSAATIAEAAEGVELAGVRQTAVRDQGRRGADATPAREARRVRRQGHAQAQREGPDGDRAGRRPGGRRLQASGARGTSPAASGTSCTTSRAGTRSSSSSRCSGRTHQGRELIALKVTQGARGGTRRLTARRCCTRRTSTRASGSASRSTAGCCTTSSPAGARTTRRSGTCSRAPSCGSSSPRTPTATSTRSTSSACGARTCATTTATGRSPSATASIPTATSPSTGATTTRARRRTRRTRPTAARAPRSEPETRAMQGLIDRIKPKFQSNLHSFGAVAAVPAGLAGRHARRGLPDLRRARRHGRRQSGDPGLQPGAVGRHAVRHQRRDDRLRRHQRRHGRLHAGARRGHPGRGLRVPGRRGADPGGVREDAARSTSAWRARRRTRRIRSRPSGIDVEPFYLDADDIDPQNGQTVAVRLQVRRLLRRPAGGARAREAQPRRGHAALPDQRRPGPAADRRASGPAASATAPATATYYHVVRGSVTGTSSGRQREGLVHRRRRDERLVHLRGRVRQRPAGADRGGRGLHRRLAASPGLTSPALPVVLHGRADGERRRLRRLRRRRPRPHRARQPRRAEPLRRRHLVHGRRRRDARAGLGSGQRVAAGDAGAARGARLRQRGRPRALHGPARRAAVHDRRSARSCTTRSRTGSAAPTRRCEARCLALSGSGNSQGDPIEYMFGAAITTAGRRHRSRHRRPVRRRRHRRPARRADAGGSTAPTAPRTRPSNSSFIATGDFLQVTDPADSFPQFESWPAAEYLSGLAGPFDPHTGQSFMWSERADEAYKRLTRTITVPAGGATLSFWTSYNLELDFDYLIVEAHTVGQDDWTTLPDENGHTSSDLSNDQSCTGGWSNPADAANVLHPFLTHYQTFDPATGTCSATGTTGEWNAANGSSSGWQQLQVDLSSVRRPAGRGLDHLAERLGPAAVPGRVHRRHRGLDRRGHHLVRGRRRPDWTAGPSPARRRTSRASRARTSTTGSAAAASASRRARSSRPPTRSTWASASRASPARRRATQIMDRAIDYLLR